MQRGIVLLPTELLKAKRMSIGTISRGRKKVAEGRWVLASRPVKNGFSEVMIKKLRKEWNKLSTVNPESPSYKALIDKLDTMDIHSLRQLMYAKIKFVSLLAKIRVSRWMQRNPTQGQEYARPILQPVFKATLFKAKYTRRWKGKDGKWNYEYAKPKEAHSVHSAQSIAHSLQIAGEQVARHKALYGAKMSKLPLGTNIAGYVHTAVGKDKFWIGKRGGFTGGRLLEETGAAKIDVALAADKKKIVVDATKMGWKVADGKKFGAELSAKNPGKYVTMHNVFSEITFTIHDHYPQNVHAPGDFKYGYARNGVWKPWSAKRKASYSNKMIEGVE